MRTRRIAVVGLADDASQAFRSMLRILDGRGNVSWQLAEPTDADVMIAGAQTDDSAAQRWARTDKPLIAVCEGAAARPLTPYSLQHPFRVMQLLGVLDDVDQALGGAETARPRAIGDACWAFAGSLRLLARSSASGHLHAAGSGEARIYVRDDLSTYHTLPETARRLARQAHDLPALRPCEEPLPGGLVARPVFELAWFTCLHGAETLAPWLDAHASHRLRRWPDFGLVRGSRDQLALAALLTHGAYSRARLIEASQQPPGRIDRFLNACALTGVLTSEPAAVAETGSTFIAHSAARLGGLIRGLRLRLGLTG
jgi:hypothetical protein